MHERPSVVLLHPRSVTGWQAQPWCDLPLELLCVGTPLTHAGYRVVIVDQRVDADWQQRLLAELARNPVCVGITSTTGPQLRHALVVTKLIKRHSDVPVVWGGIHASLLPEQTLAEPEIDYVVQGEGEVTFLELAGALARKESGAGIPGVWHRDGGRVTCAGSRPFIDLNQQPPLAYDLVDVLKYTRTVFGVRRLSFSTSRGCTFPCTYCYNTSFHRRQWRALAPDVAVAQIKDFLQRYSIRGLFLTDANFFLDMDRARGILEGVLRENLGVVFSRLHVRLDSLLKMSDEDLALIERAGCKCLAIGIESGSPRIQKLFRKSIDVAALLDLNRRLSRFSIVPLYFFMLGVPTETVEDLRATVDLFTRLVKENPRAIKSLNVYTPFPGTELYDLAVSEGLVPPARLEDWAPFNYRHLGAQAAWLPREMCRLIEMLDFCSFFVGDSSYLRPVKKTNPLVVMAANLYAPLARKRVETLTWRWPVEIRLAKALGLYGKQR
jgi:radical SAM superfamily enzyme YgiQ (UPF0313 family)